MKFKKLIVLLLTGIVLTGCFGEEKLPMEFLEDFSYKNQIVQYMPADCVMLDTEAFTANLCVVEEDYKENKNSSLTAVSTLIFDITKQEVLYADNVYEKLYPASVTKILTVLVALEQCNDLSELVTVSYNASHIMESGAKKCGFEEGDQISMKDLLYSFLVYSGNDAGIAIAEHISGSESKFATLMNEKAIELGAIDSHFVNAHGLHSDEHYTTAYDMYLIFNECIKNKTFVDMINTVRYTANYKNAIGEKKQKTFDNTNRYLLGMEKAPEDITVIGGKTGTTQKAGSCLVLYSKDKKQHQYISVVFKAENSNDLFQQMTTLLKYAD